MQYIDALGWAKRICPVKTCTSCPPKVFYSAGASGTGQPSLKKADKTQKEKGDRTRMIDR